MKILKKRLFLAQIITLILVILGCGITKDEDKNGSTSSVSETVDVFAQNRLLGRGINLGGRWENNVKEEHYKKIKDIGFDSVRFPILPNRYSLLEEPYTIEPGFLEALDRGIQNCIANDLVAIIDMHDHMYLSKDPLDKKDWFFSIWEQIAELAKDYPDDVFFELLNEPWEEMTPRLWNEFLEELVPLVRKTNPNRTLIIGPACANDIAALDALRIPEGERNVIVTFHYYEPLTFTHQGTRWIAGSDAWLGASWGTDNDIKILRRDIYRAVAWSIEHNLPLFLGEFGAVYNADIESRVKWTSFVTREAERNEISWAYWNFNEEPNFYVYSLKTEEWNTPILEALIPPEE